MLDWAWLSLTLVDDAGMIPIHAAHFGDHRTTDVVSCAYAPQPGVTEGWIGEVYVNVQRAMEEGEQRQGGPAAEFALYVAHGLDHLSGATDDTEARRRTMLRREEAWIRDFPVNDLLGPAKD